MGDKWHYGSRQFYPSQNHSNWYNQTEEEGRIGYIKEEYRDENGKIDLQKLPIYEAGWLEPEKKVEQGYLGNPGDFTEFFFDGISSKSLGITRVSGGDRYDLDLQPTLKNKTIEVPGGNGSYFFGSNYKDKSFTIEIAFDNLTEGQIRKIANIFSPCNELKDLYFQNHPYKVWRVKITQPIILNTICFDEGPNHRRYKGEGAIKLQAFSPFAKERIKYLDEYVKEHRKNRKLNPQEAEIYVQEWAEGSKLLWNKENIIPIEKENGVTRKQWYPYDTTASVTKNSNLSPGLCHIWNAGDFDTDYMLYFWKQDPDSLDKKYNYRIRCSDAAGGNEYGEFKIKDLQLSNSPNKITQFLEHSAAHFVAEGNAETITIEDSNITIEGSQKAQEYYANIDCIDEIIPGKGKSLILNIPINSTGCTVYIGSSIGAKDLATTKINAPGNYSIQLDNFLKYDKIYLSIYGSNILFDNEKITYNSSLSCFKKEYKGRQLFSAGDLGKKVTLILPNNITTKSTVTKINDNLGISYNFNTSTDKPTNYPAYIITNEKNKSTARIWLNSSSTEDAIEIKAIITKEISIKIDSISVVELDAGFRINSKLSLIEGVDSNGEPTGNVYNQYKSGGEYFKLPQGESWIIIDEYYKTWFRSKTHEDEEEIAFPGQSKKTKTVINTCNVMWLRNQNFLSGLKEEDISFEYHDQYL